MRRKLALFLAVLMSITTVAGCGQEKVPTQTSENEVQTSTETASQETEDVRENVTVELVCFQYPNFQDNFYDYIQDSPVYEEFVKQTGVELEVVGLDKDQTNIRISGGDVGDVVMIRSIDELNALIEADLVVPWNEYIEEYAPNIIEDLPAAWEWSTTIGGRDGDAYCLSILSGSEGAINNPLRYLYTVRWDLYKELGCPEITDMDSFLKVLADMQALQPTTKDGKPVYGTSFTLKTNAYNGMALHIAATAGITSVKGYYVWNDIKTGEILYDFANENAPYWMATEFYNKAYRMGILDPDCFTQTSDDYSERVVNGEILTHYLSATTSYTNTNETGDGFVIIPVEDTMIYQNSPKEAGWGFNYGLCLTKECENPERVAEMLSYTFTPEGSRTLRSGVEGVQWDYVDGVPAYNEETFKILTQGTPEETNATGISVPPLSYFAGVGNGVIAEDGYLVGLQHESNYINRLEKKRYELEYADYFGVTSQYDRVNELIAEGELYDFAINPATYDDIIPTEDISRIDNICMSIAIEAIPKLVMASSADEYQQIKTEILAKLEAAGAKEAEAFYVNARNADIAAKK